MQQKGTLHLLRQFNSHKTRKGKRGMVSAENRIKARKSTLPNSFLRLKIKALSLDIQYSR